MEVTSPTKRRVLGSLDPNASPRPTRLDAKQLANAPSSPLKRVTVFSASPSQPEANKRPLLFGELAAELLHPAKKVCQEDNRRNMAAHESGRVSEMRESKTHDQTASAPERRQSASPEPSSLFDSSVIDTSQATTITEPDVIGVTAAAAAAASTLGPIPRPATRPRLTREEAREKAEILKLRLGLASYKLRTGQTDIPLEQLELQSATRHRRVQSRNGGGGWASSRLQSQLQQQRAELAAGAGVSSSGSFGRHDQGQAAGRRALPAAPVRRTSSDDVGANASFSSQVQWSQGSSDGQAENAADEGARQEVEGGGRLASSWEHVQTQTPRRQFRVEVEADEERLTSSALRGGAASGLLSLAQARS
ncbi:hypothetical protein CONLIGDRAFT_677690 [Coniochaeta ligniaria NRRL 30616]|uniref:Cyclin-dependent kinase n=1 Tax=Coniochaeta ligniaria NRRL 30616 TaxID=1408157 RepID=A0A1J7JV94_9PEZI|nr:hypothetical protein CONLIGDRAFT_677690 [Coniochaeta ligniaria NRRL 30616]